MVTDELDLSDELSAISMTEEDHRQILGVGEPINISFSKNCQGGKSEEYRWEIVYRLKLNWNFVN